MQPDLSIYFKSFMELDKANLVSIFAFDSRVVRALIGREDRHTEHKYPIFYKIKEAVTDEMGHVVDYKIVTALETAL